MLLARHGIEGLTTSMIAQEMQMSVGALYHYFPNKHSILSVLATGWLEDMTFVLDDVLSKQTGEMSIERLTENILEGMHDVYRKQEAVLPLAQGLSAIPELRHLDAEHDNLIISKMIEMLRRAGFTSTKNELNRVARVFLELTHSLLIVAVDQDPIRSSRTMTDMKIMVSALLKKHEAETAAETRNVEAP
ncbi:transcriptional regulator, TetR family [Congregibacter litoralis KT71]|uniref:Transcriptional regulator, TetR family n=2 Tax=Congregibacter TaxID=393661 RepID=A4ADY1_9GAMM|nr:transcriptional regulator, TetR family [Congregibacter litoralis KT71]